MDSNSFSLFKDFQLTSTKQRLSDSDFVDRLNHYFAVLIFLTSSIVICTKQYLVGDPLQCWVPKEFNDAWEQYAENYCWVENTYFVKRNASLSNDHHSELQYYQWVPFVLVLQGLMFYLPFYFWRSINWMSGVDIRHMMFSALDASSLDQNKKTEAINVLVNQYQESFLEKVGDKFIIKSKSYMSISYIITKLLYVINVLIQFLLISSFLNTNFALFGINILKNYFYKNYWDETGLFPRTTFCHFNIRTIDLNRPYTIQCVLVVNMVVEKVYIFLWFFMVIILVTNCVSFMQWLIWLSCRRKAVLSKPIENQSLTVNVWDSMNSDSLFVLRLLKKNCLGINYFAFLKEFNAKTVLHEDNLEMSPI